MMAYDTMGIVILGVIFGVLAAIVYSLRVLVIMERRIARMDAHIEVITRKIAKEEMVIERKEREILDILRADKAKRVQSSTKKPVKKK